MKKGTNEEFPFITGAAVGVIGFLMSPDFWALLGIMEKDSATQLAHFQTAVTWAAFVHALMQSRNAGSQII